MQDTRDGIEKGKKDGVGKFQYHLFQHHLIQRMIEFAAITDSRLHDTPAEPNLLHKDQDGDHCKLHWSYRSIIRIVKLFMWNKT